MIRVLFAFLLLLAAGSANAASTAAATVSAAIKLPLTVIVSPAGAQVSCNAAAGAVLETLSTIGGDGNPVTWSIAPQAGVTATDFALSGNQIVVGASGIAAADCGAVATIAVTATQP